MTITNAENKNIKDDKSGSSEIIEKSAKSQKYQKFFYFKSLKNFAEYKKSIRNSIKFKIFNWFGFLYLAVKLAYIY